MSPAAPSGHVAEAEDPSGQVAGEQSPLPPPLCRHRWGDLADEDFAANCPAYAVHADQEESQVVADDLVCEQANGPLYSSPLTAHGDAAGAPGKDVETAAAGIDNDDDDDDHHDDDGAAAAITSACIDLLKEPGQHPEQQPTGVDNAKIAFIRLFRSKLCTTVQATPIVRGVLCAEGYAIDDESLQLLCKTGAGTFQ